MAVFHYASFNTIRFFFLSTCIHRFDQNFKFYFKKQHAKASFPAAQTSGLFPSTVSRQTLLSKGLPLGLRGPEALPPAVSLHTGDLRSEQRRLSAWTGASGEGLPSSSLTAKKEIPVGLKGSPLQVLIYSSFLLSGLR